MSSEKTWGIHWFRRDLRIADNSALRENWDRTQGHTLGIFCFDSEFLARPDFSPNRFAFFLKTLRALKAEFASLGGDLLVVDQLPHEFFTSLLEGLKRERKSAPVIVTWNRDYEPFARARDAKVADLLSAKGIEVQTARDHLIFEPDEIKKDAGGFYQVFTPFSRKWLERLSSSEGGLRISSQRVGSKPSATKIFSGSWQAFKSGKSRFIDSLDQFEKANKKDVTVPIPDAGFAAARRQLKKFVDGFPHYDQRRDRPDLAGTSRLSIYVKNGSLTTAQICKVLDLQKQNPTQFLKEIVWREFYYHILFHRPDVERNAFHPQYQNLKWQNREDYFERWKDGTTGFPIVDAGMRQLRQTGWMHNRVRMIVSSFLVKDLLIDWRWGERHFMRELLDGDLAANNGGWQWAASTGCDPQPYFRIFNPWLQGKKFDPQGAYIKEYVSELRDIPTAALHNADADRGRAGYPEPLVDHSTQRALAIRLFKRS